MADKTMYTVSSSPHIKSKVDTRSIMRDVIIALVPALIASVVVFGIQALVVTLVSVASCVFFEWLYRKLMKMDQTITDLSCVVTGVLMSFCLPPTIPLWVVIIGAAFAIIIVKQLFGGLGKNFMNPALAARAFMFSWPVLMTTWAAPLKSGESIFNIGVDAVTAATPMAAIHAGNLPEEYSIMNMFMGRIGGSLGEVSALALIIGGIYLVAKKIISPRIPLSYIGTVAIITLISSPSGIGAVEWMLYNVLGGGLLLGAIFMATDYSTSPVTPKGQVVFGIGCGLITLLIRYFGAYSEGVSYAILVMNTCVWLIDKAFLPRRFGVSKEEAKAIKKQAKADKKAAKEVGN